MKKYPISLKKENRKWLKHWTTVCSGNQITNTLVHEWEKGITHLKWSEGVN